MTLNFQFRSDSPRDRDLEGGDTGLCILTPQPASGAVITISVIVSSKGCTLHRSVFPTLGLLVLGRPCRKRTGRPYGVQGTAGSGGLGAGDSASPLGREAGHPSPPSAAQSPLRNSCLALVLFPAHPLALPTRAFLSLSPLPKERSPSWASLCSCPSLPPTSAPGPASRGPPCPQGSPVPPVPPPGVIGIESAVCPCGT